MSWLSSVQGATAQQAVGGRGAPVAEPPLLHGHGRLRRAALGSLLRGQGVRRGPLPVRPAPAGAPRPVRAARRRPRRADRRRRGHARGVVRRRRPPAALCLVQLVGDLGHGRPHLAVERQAPERQLGHLVDGGERPRVPVRVQVRVHDVVHAAPADPVHGELRQVHLTGRPGQVDGLHGGDDLHEHDAEAVHVAPVGEVEVLVVLRVDVPRRALRRRGDVGGVPQRRLAQPRQPEVGDLGVVLVVEQDVAGLDVAVVDGRVHLRVQVRDGLGCLGGDAEAHRPRHRRGAALPLQVLRQRAVGHELVHQDLLPLLDAAAEEADEVAVAHARHQLHLVHDAVEAGVVALPDPLHGNKAAVAEPPGVHGAVGARAQALGVGEAVGGALDLAVRVEGHRAGGLRQEPLRAALRPDGRRPALQQLVHHAGHARYKGTKHDSCKKFILHSSVNV
jgi:hypothetical protein